MYLFSLVFLASSYLCNLLLKACCLLFALFASLCELPEVSQFISDSPSRNKNSKTHNKQRDSSKEPLLLGYSFFALLLPVVCCLDFVSYLTVIPQRDLKIKVAKVIEGDQGQRNVFEPEVSSIFFFIADKHEEGMHV